MRKIIFIFLGLLSLSANAVQTKSETVVGSRVINSTLGEFHFVLHNLEHRPYSYDTNRAEIQITSIEGRPIQTIPVEVSFPRPGFDFIDLNDDGYIDLLFYSSDIPNGSIPLPEIYLYIPKLNRFVKSTTLSGNGEITKSNQHGCVNIILERNIDGYTEEEWCFTLETGRWKKVKENVNQIGE